METEGRLALRSLAALSRLKVKQEMEKAVDRKARSGTFIRYSDDKIRIVAAFLCPFEKESNLKSLVIDRVIRTVFQGKSKRFRLCTKSNGHEIFFVSRAT